MPNRSKPARRRRRRLPAGMTTNWVEPDIENLRNSVRTVNINSGESNNKPRKRSSKRKAEKPPKEVVTGYLEQCNNDITEECDKAYAFLERSLQEGNSFEEYDFDLFFGGVLSKMVLYVLNRGNMVNWNIITQLLERNSSKRNICPYPPANDPVVMKMETSIIRMYYVIVSDPERRHSYHYYIK